MDFSSREIRQLQVIRDAMLDALEEKGKPEFLLEGYREVELIMDALTFVIIANNAEDK